MTDQPNPLCICGQKYTMTEDNHAVNCPAHAYYAAWQKMQPIPSPQGAAMSDWPEYEPVWKMIENRVSGASPQAGVEALREALTEIAGMYSKWDPDGSYAASALFQASERARQALASLPASTAIEAGPVAWLYEWKPIEINNKFQASVSIEDPRIKGAHIWEFRNVIPLFAAPQPAEPSAVNTDDPQEIEDWLDEAIQDSIDMDWTSRIGAKAIIRQMESDGYAFVKAPAAIDEGVRERVARAIMICQNGEIPKGYAEAEWSRHSGYYMRAADAALSAFQHPPEKS